MNITCHYCNAKLNIPDHKIPKDKDTAVTCPKCKEKIPIPAQSRVSSEPSPGDVEKSGVRLSFEDRLNAMLCIGDVALLKKTQNALRIMGFSVEQVSKVSNALSQMEYHLYHLVVVDETFDQNYGLAQMIEKMNTIDMSLRRRICLVMLSTRFQTNDNMASLHASVNNILNTRDITHIESFLIQAMQTHKNLYTVYNESLKLAGKA
jgi:predicted Zn finger-like uncharacterized protein